MNMAKKRVNKSQLTDTLNNRVTKMVRWCTPSIDLHSSQVRNPYLSDTSISYESLGSPFEPSGIFEKIYNAAQKAYGADHTLFSVNGTTGSNFMVLRALSKQIPNLRILAERNVHRSIVVACEDYGINLIFLPPHIDQDLQLFLPNTEKEIYDTIAKTKPHVFLMTNPTYEGITLNLKKIIATINRKFPSVIVFVDEAWGAHLHFSEKLPISAMDASADISVQSTHKQGGALQQAGMIHWKDGRVNTELMMDSYRSLITGSPSFLLLASLDAARAMMEKSGERKIGHSLTIAKKITKGINAISGLEVISTKKLKKANPSVYERDETKVIVNVHNANSSGFTIAKLLERKYGIIAEEYNANTILLLVPFRATLHDVERTVNALREIMENPKPESEISKFDFTIPTNIPRVLELSDVAKLLWNQIEQVPLVKAGGRISAEHISPFPPGIPLTIKGEEFTQEIVDYYLKLRHHPNAHIISQDKTLERVWVVK